MRAVKCVLKTPNIQTWELNKKKRTITEKAMRPLLKKKDTMYTNGMRAQQVSSCSKRGEWRVTDVGHLIGK